MEDSLIFEIGTEEVPARFIKDYAEQVKSGILSLLSENRLINSSDCEWYYTPRRVIFIHRSVKVRQENEEREVLGPPVRVCYDKNGVPQKALTAFLQKFGIKPEELYRVQSPKGEVVAARIMIEGRDAISILSDGLKNLITSIKFKKSMRWGNNDIPFVRPIRWIVAMLGKNIIPLEINGIKADNRSYGNFNVDKSGFEFESVDAFLKGLEERFVVYDVEKRREIVKSSLKSVFDRHNLKLIINEPLLDEVVNILEYPVPIEGGFDEVFLNLPIELLEIVQVRHQRYFPLLSGRTILPKFLAFANNPIGDKEIIRTGMEKVLRARLNDAVFFYNEDKKRDIRDMAASLNMVLYQKVLGNYDRKRDRIVEISRFISNMLGLDDKTQEKIKTVAQLCKADLVSLSVGEFPELQGVMGKYFALNLGFDEDIANAIEEHYKPRSSEDDIPDTLIGSVVSIADKIDHLCGLFLINQQPSASSDPFGARRAASGVIDIISGKRLYKVSTSALIDKGLSLYDENEIKRCDDKIVLNKNAREELLDFFRVRIKMALSEKVKPDVAEAILNAGSGIDDISSIFERLEALKAFIEGEDFDKFAVVYKRASNITKDFNSTTVNENLFEYDEERELYSSIQRIRDNYLEMIAKRDYFRAMQLLRENLYEPVFKFFDKVFVMVEDEMVKNNRLAILKNVVILFKKIIDLSYISSM
jgi:glycyl-tRNA synthetase beta chain